MSQAMDASQTRHAEIVAELARVNKDLRNTLRREKRRLSVPASLWRVVTIIYALTHPAVEPAGTFLKQKWQHWGSEEDRIKILLRGWYAQLLFLSSVNSVLQPTTKIGRDSLSKAQSFLQEFELHKWVDKANKTQGIAPMSSIMLQRAGRIDHVTGRLPILKSSTQRKHQFQWLRRWRRRWNVGLGAMKPRDTLPPAECAQKAAKNVVFAPPKKNCINTRNHMGCIQCEPNWCQNMALILGPSDKFTLP